MRKNRTLLQSRAFYPWLILLLAAGFFFAEYFARVAPSVMVPQLMQAFNVNALSLGALSAFFYYAYVAMQLPVGTLMDRFGPRLLLSLMAAICGLSCVLFATTHDLFLANISRFLMGFSAAFAFVGALKIARTWFSAKRFGFLAGLTQALGMVGAAVGEGPVSYLVESYGWRKTMIMIGAVLLILALLIAVLVRNKKTTDATNKDSIYPKDKKTPILQSLRVVLKNPQTWVNGLVVGCLYAPTAAFAELWGASYINVVYNIKVEVAATGVGLIFIGWAIASPLVGLLSDKIGRRKPVIIGSLILSLIFMGLVLYMPHLSKPALFILLFCYGLSNVGVATCYAVACEMADTKVGATSMSFANMASVIIGALFQPLIGFLLIHHASGPLDKSFSYNASDYHFAMLALPLCFLVGLCACFWLKETLVKS